MKTFVLINAILELVAGMVLFLSPSAVPEMKGETAMAYTFTRMYGGAAIALGYYAWMVWRNYGPGPVARFLKTFVFFHALVATAAFFGYSQGINSFIGVCMLHLILALATGYFILKNR